MSPDNRPPKLGVLFVHGIGEQTESENVRWFAGSLIEWLTWWYRARPAIGALPRITSSHLSYGQTLDGPARVEMSLPASTHDGERQDDRHWVIAEGWWAARIDPPGLRQMVVWAWHSSWRALGRLATEAMDRVGLILVRLGGRPRRPPAKSDPGALGALVELLSTTLLTLLYIAALPLLYGLVLLLWLVTLVPIQQLRELAIVKLIEPFLVTGVGDFRTYLEDDVQALHIRSRLADDIRWLVEESKCGDLVVVAHSHGAVVAFDALSSGTLPHLDRVRKFISVGAALNSAWNLHPESDRLLRTLPAHIHWLDVWSYYDPVPGGQLERRIRGAPPLVAPDPALSEEMRWYEEYVFPERAAKSSRTPPTSALPRQVTNGMNVATDHDGYWRNPEQFMSRLAAELDEPRRYYGRSRFAVADREPVRRRRLRVTTLVGWRLLAMGAFLMAVIRRMLTHGPTQLTTDGAAIADAVRSIPGSEVLEAPAAALGGLRDFLVSASPSSPEVVRGLIRRVIDLLELPLWNDLWHLVIALVAYGALLVATYLVVVWALWRPLDRAESRESVAPGLPPHEPLVLIRTLIAVAVFGLAAYLIGR